MLHRLRTLLEMIRFSHTLFALPFALLAAIMAWTTPFPTHRPPPFRWQDLFGILICMVAARSAAMAFNRWLDAEFDDRLMDDDDVVTEEVADHVDFGGKEA